MKSCQQLLVKGLGDNPRQVKRFINTLMLNHQLASGLDIPDYTPVILAMLLLIQYRNPEFYRSIAAKPGLLLKLVTENEEGTSLRDSFLSKDPRLNEALNSIYIPKDALDETLLKRYIYLTQVARITEDIQTGGYQLNLPGILSLHKEWLLSKGEKGKQANLSEADLYQANLSEANLSGADLIGTLLIGANLSEANLSEANLSGANLSGADLSGADLHGAILSQAELSGADLHGANMTNALGMTKKQIESANVDNKTKLPAYLQGPDQEEPEV